MSTESLPAGSLAAAGETRRWPALAALLTGNFVTILDLFIVNVAIPDIRAGLHANFAQIQLVMVGYSAAYAVFLLNGARLGDLFGRKRMFLTGMALFTLASALCGLASTPWMLIAMRVGQGLGAAILMPQVMASLRVLFDGDARRRAFGTMGAVQGVAASISQIIGGWLIAHPLAADVSGWRAVFLVNVPIGVTALLAARAFVAESRAPVAARLDVHGAVAGAVALVMLLVPVMLGRESGWPWWSWTVPLAALLVVRHFVRVEQALSAAGRVPIIEIALFRNRSFVLGVLAIFLFYTAMSSYFLALTILLQFGRGLTALAAGLVFTPAAIAFFAGSLTGPRLAERIGQYALLLGVAIFAIGLVLLAAMAQAGAPTAWFILPLVLNGFGQGMVIPLSLNTILSSVETAQAGMGAGTVTTMQAVGNAVGVTVVGVLLFSLLGHVDGTDAASPAAHAAHYGHAFALATLYNVGATVVALVLFWRAWRRHA
ncbi:Multidrug resistance protein Stp [Ralstonia condita]|uniref:Multidrug resistance protein Stp n=1 Tax=Ralstonia condita TaxID=3058600 RepID=A0ABN9JA69_9RALS|nr:MFS transporter [Ralstonia sp. LMG 7141]CAJ0800538.1 Multidrug resistance protein Stp [Ralstonia sp. LMG 7141]